MADQVLSRRALNRSLLARQLLLDRPAAAVPAGLAQLIGLQAQAQTPPYVALWNRVADFDPTVLSDLLVDRQVVRLALMRSTIFLCGADDALALRPLLQTGLDRALRGVVGPRLVELDVEAVAAEVRALVEVEPRTLDWLGGQLARRWPEFEPADLARVARTVVALVQVPPRGVWGQGGPAAHTSLESWVGRPLDRSRSLEWLVLRYLDAFGPASVADMQTWSGLTRLAAVVERLRPRLRGWRDDAGVELLDRPDAPRPDPDIDAPARLLGEFDNVLLAHVDRSRVLADVSAKRVMTSNGLVRGVALVDGFVRGTWRMERGPASATVVVSAFAPIARRDRAALAAQAAALSDLLTPGTTADLAVVAPG